VIPNRHEIRWIADKPKKDFTSIPNALTRAGNLGSLARSVAVYLWSHQDGWKLSATSIADALGVERRSVAKALEELAADRWLAIHKTGKTAREYLAHPSRQLTVEEHSGLTAHGRKTAIPGADHGTKPAMTMAENVPSTMAQNVPLKNTNDKTSEKPLGFSLKKTIELEPDRALDARDEPTDEFQKHREAKRQAEAKRRQDDLIAKGEAIFLSGKYAPKPQPIDLGEWAS
jgi:hypothetical protein